ncbi:hypothetical protein [Paenibacillus chitinolyticus]|uniref:hypothetical protein n=1 Tax=Paenibacillus chitinolyticus TaxID=79263 RepID=UPI001C479045|nr:hypothetical protein [Paenibacillus chitinolyticus]MBV6716551.1 hypothetical protein [Paenibacillus chitinolyticus]
METNEQLETCMQLGVSVEAWVFDSFDKVGFIQQFDDTVVVIGNEYYVRECCSFFGKMNP